jgi:hypothetical protein
MLTDAHYSSPLFNLNNMIKQVEMNLYGEFKIRIGFDGVNKENKTKRTLPCCGLTRVVIIRGGPYALFIVFLYHSLLFSSPFSILIKIIKKKKKDKLYMLAARKDSHRTILHH